MQNAAQTRLFRRGLKINFAALDLHIRSNKLRPNKKWYDDVVIVTTYVGPISKQK